jgi:hypothetical protein
MRLSDIARPVPTELIVFLDEHPDSINDGWFATEVNNPTQRADLPAIYHGKAGGLGFADGHGAIHKWGDASMAQPVLKEQRNWFNVPARTGHLPDQPARFGAALSLRQAGNRNSPDSRRTGPSVRWHSPWRRWQVHRDA